MVKGNMLIDERKQIAVNLVIFRSHGLRFEIAIEPDKIIKYKNGEKIDVEEIVQAEKIFTDMKKGMVASDDVLENIFGTSDFLVIAKKMIDEGEIQFTHKYREDLREKKFRKIVEIIHRNAINPKTNLPHPITRIEGAIEEAKVKIDENKSAEEQVKSIISLLQPIIPISIQESEFQIHVPVHFAAKVKTMLKSEGDIINERWFSDGSAIFNLKISSGRSMDLISKLNSQTHASVSIEKIK